MANNTTPPLTYPRGTTYPNDINYQNPDQPWITEEFFKGLYNDVANWANGVDWMRLLTNTTFPEYGALYNVSRPMAMPTQAQSDAVMKMLPATPVMQGVMPAPYYGGALQQQVQPFYDASMMY